MPIAHSADLFPILSTTDAPPDWFRGKNLIDSEFGRWTITGFAWRRGNSYYWWCKCSCDRRVLKPVGASSLKGGDSISCGCYNDELLIARVTTHGKSSRGDRTPEYNAWQNMRRRCGPAYEQAKDYHDRGIAVCERWRNDFAAFLKDMGERPSPKHTVERKDNNLGYSPENCIWATRATQLRNKRNNNNLEFRGRTMCQQDWAKELGITSATLIYRIRNWGLERAMTTPAMTQFCR